MTAASSDQQRLLPLLVHLVRREMRIRYRRAALGFLWLVIQPLARFAILALVFGRVLELDIENYAAFLFIGVVLWQWFANAVRSGSSSVVDRAELVATVGFPRVAVPLISIATDFVDLLAALPVLVVVLLFSSGLPATAPLVVVPLFLLMVLIVGTTLVLSSVNVRLRDTALLVDTALLLGFYATPVFYDRGIASGTVETVLGLNPLARILEASRSVLISGTAPDWDVLAGVAAGSAALLAVGTTVFARRSPTFLDEL